MDSGSAGRVYALPLRSCAAPSSGPTVRYADEPRVARLGSSEVAAVLGLSKWKTAFGVWAAKVGLPGTDSTDSDGPRRVGRYMESGILRWLADDLGAELVPAGGYDTPWVVSARWPFVGCHPDGYLLHAGAAQPHIRWGLAEAKTASAPWPDDDVPPGYWIQCQVGMALTGLPACDLGVLWPIARAFSRRRIEPDDKTTHEVLERVSAWWERHVVREEPPAVDASDDARRWLLSAYPRERAPLREATAEEATLAREVARLRAEIRERQDTERGLAHRLEAAIGDHGGLTLPGGRATWRAQTSKRVDVTRLRAERPEVADEFTTATETRVLRVSIKEES